MSINNQPKNHNQDVQDKHMRIDDFEWHGQSYLPQITSVKTPKYYLTTIKPENNDDPFVEDIYFVNNTDKVLNYVGNYNLLNDKDKSAHKTTPMLPSSEGDLLYENVQPYQGVKIDSHHIMYHSDGIGQYDASTLYFDSKDDCGDTNIEDDNNWEMWDFRVHVKGVLNRPQPLVWNDNSIPKSSGATLYS